MNIKTRLESNISALKVVKVRMGNSYNPLDENKQIEVLRKWNGCGSTKGVLNNWSAVKGQWEADGASKEDINNYDLYQELFEAIYDLFPYSEHKKVMDSVKNSTLTAFYTPEVIPRTFYEVLKEHMQVRTIYEPSAGSGVFLQEAFAVFPEIEQVCAYEKDILTATILESIIESQYGHTIYNKPFEESSDNENDKYDLITSNIPFGDVKIYDPKFTDRNITARIHNYFFAKGIDKIRDGGILAYLVSDAFLNTVSNKTIRKYVFDRCDFISLTVMPDNLMMDNANTIAPSHFLVVQKNSSKTELSPEEELLVESSFVDIPNTPKYAMNHYIKEKWIDDNNTMNCFVYSKMSIGKNQYGKPAVEVKWDKSIEEIAEPFREILQRDFEKRFKREKTLLETFQELGEIMGARLLTITENESPLDDIRLETSEYDLGEASTCCGCGIGMFGNDPLCFKCKQEELKELLPKYVPFKDGIIVEK